MRVRVRVLACVVRDRRHDDGTRAAPAFAAPKFRSRQSSSCVVCERERERESRKVSCLVPVESDVSSRRNSRYSKKARRESICLNAHRFTCRSYLSKTPARSSPRSHRATRIASRSRTRKTFFSHYYFRRRLRRRRRPYR